MTRVMEIQPAILRTGAVFCFVPSFLPLSWLEYYVALAIPYTALIAELSSPDLEKGRARMIYAILAVTFLLNVGSRFFGAILYLGGPYFCSLALLSTILASKKLATAGSLPPMPIRHGPHDMRVWNLRVMLLEESLRCVGMATTNSEETRITRRWPFSVFQRAIGQSDSDLMAPDFESFRRQEALFAVLNQILIAALLALQVFSRFIRGRPAASVIAVLAFGLAVESMHVAWLHYRRTARCPLRLVRYLPSGRSGLTQHSRWCSLSLPFGATLRTTH